MGEEFTLEDMMIVLQRRVMYFLLPALILAPVGILFVMLLPAKYTAQGTILVESQQISERLVESAINTYAQERIQVIRQRVMTRNRLLGVADKYKLFPGERRLSESERVERMRDQLEVELISSNTKKNKKNQTDGTIAFTVSYTDQSPDKAFQVANEFMSLFLTEDSRSRSAGASNTTEFFRGETQRLRATVDAIEDRISRYKSQHASALPEHLNMHLDMLERANRDLGLANNSTSLLEEEVRSLETQLTSYFAGANINAGPAQELTKLKSELVQLRSIYHDVHPNVQALRKQINALERQLAPSRDIQLLRSTLAKAETDFADAENADPKDEAIIAEKRQALEDIREELNARIERETSNNSGDFLSAQLQGRLDIANNRKRSLGAQADGLKTTISDLQTRIAQTPEVERGLSALTRDYENVFNEYQEVLTKQQSAQLAENLEDDQRAEKFSILEPALRPDQPSSPARGKLSVLAVFMALGAGLLAALGAEVLLARVRGRNHLVNLMEEPPIAVIPYIRQENESRFNLPFFKKKSLGFETEPAL